jgi:radical SAM superfamily enzyme YgiQ (UPF0313 family)
VAFPVFWVQWPPLHDQDIAMRIKRFGIKPRRRILLVNPAGQEDLWTMGGTARILGRKALMPCPALATLVALTPADLGVEYVLCDENVGRIPWNKHWDLVAVTGYSVHAARTATICKGFRARGVPVALGGIYATVEPDQARALADFLFLGEAEHTWPEFLRAWVQGRARSEYRQEQPIDMAHSPPPDWSLIRPTDYLLGAVQTTRGCPNRCEFCEVIKVFGRTFRHKSVEQVLAEVRASRVVSRHALFFSDDNFVVDKRFTKELLRGLIAYNRTLKAPLSFATQATVAIAEDEELLRLMADAGFEMVFLGVESPRQRCLEEIGKQHVSRLDAVEAVKRISRHGIATFVGLICGFDHDDADTFAELGAFIESTSSPVVVLSLLNAIPGTPLHDRLSAENRVLSDSVGEWYFGTNIVPRSMSREQLVVDHRRLLHDIYRTDRFHDRLRRWLASVEYFGPLFTQKSRSWSQLRRFLRVLFTYCVLAPRADRKAFFRGMRDTARRDRRLMRPYMMMMCHFWHFSHFMRHERWKMDLVPVPTYLTKEQRDPSGLPDPSASSRALQVHDEISGMP